MKEALKEHAKETDEKLVDEFSGRLNYIKIDFKDAPAYLQLKEKIKELSKSCEDTGNYIFYLATIPSLFGEIAVNLGKAGLSSVKNGYSRIIVEKPFGYDLNSAIELNNLMHTVFNEDQIYRIDHYLGKETVRTYL